MTLNTDLIRWSSAQLLDTPSAQKRRMVLMWKRPICENSIWVRLKCLLLDHVDLMISTTPIPVIGMMPSVLLTIWIGRMRAFTWQRKVPWTVGTVGLRSSRFRLAKRWPPDYGTWGLYCQSPRRNSLQIPFRPTIHESHITSRSSAESSALSSGGPAPWRRTWTLDLSHLIWQRQQKSRSGLDAISTLVVPVFRRLLRRITERSLTWSLSSGQSNGPRIYLPQLSLGMRNMALKWVKDPVSENRILRELESIKPSSNPDF